MTTLRPSPAPRAALSMALALLVLGSGTASAKTTLRWKFKEGEVLRYAMDQTTVSTGQDPSGRELKQTIGLIMDMTWTVKSVDASGSATLIQKIDRIRTSASSPFGKFSFDSKEAGDAGSVAGPLFKMLVGAEFTSKMNAKGEMSDIKLSDKLLATLRGDNEPAGAQGQFSEAGLKNMLAQIVVPLADGEVAPGEGWERKMAIPAGPDGQTREITQSFRYKGPDAASGGVEALEFSTKFEPHKADPNVPVTFKKETATGTIDFDNTAGRIVKSNTAEDVEVSISIEGKEVPQKVETTRILTLSKDQAP